MKTEELIKGKWYFWRNYHKNSPDGLKYWKFDSIRAVNEHYYFERINVDGEYILQKNWVGNCYDSELVDISEIAKYLPVGHIDLKQLSLIETLVL